jgi:hypothetical protein
MEAKLKDKRTSITTVPSLYLSFATFQACLLSHWSLVITRKQLFEDRNVIDNSAQNTSCGFFTSVQHVGNLQLSPQTL